jgi:hypothetical protein
MTKNLEHAREVGRTLLDQGAGVEELLQAFRRRELGILDSIRLVRDLLGISLGEAKKVVHLSQTWADLRAANDSFHDQLLSSVKEIATQSRGSIEIIESTDPEDPIEDS